MTPTRLLFVVAREDSARLEYIRHHFAGEPGVEIVIDRRGADRRFALDVHPAERAERRGGRDRREQQVHGDLTALGWMLITTEPANARAADEPPC
jgi:hypothetical protein